MNETERMKELVKKLNEAAKAYYQEDREIMSNLEYDTLYDELQVLEEKTGVTLAGSPTTKVGYEAMDELPKEAHESPMLSLDKTKDVEVLRSFIGDHKTLLSWKMDGLTVVLTYRGGTLAKAVTRGNGVIGEVVTNNAKVFENIPLKIPYQGELVLRGEAIIRYSDFEKINEEIEDVDAKYKNPRNLCSGSVRQLNNEITAKRHVHFMAFALVSAPEQDFENSRIRQMEWLKEQGFEVVEYKAVTKDNLDEAMQYFSTKIETNDFPSDGLVALYDDIAYGESLGTTAKFPRNAFAFKWADEQKETTLLEIEWSPSRTGLINPVAVFEPVELEGTSVSRASVHNISIMRSLDLGVGDKILVYKANMIIPQIAENLTRSGVRDIPETCPACGGATRIQMMNNVETLYCTNPECPAKFMKAFTLFVSRDAMNIDGMSEATLEKFVGHGFIREFADIFRLDRYRDEIVEMDGFDQNEGVIVMAATNRQDILDPALLRPGRFDRQIYVGYPDIKGREEILKVHAKKVKIAPGVDFNTVARMASGASGAELANIVNEAALRAVRAGRKSVTQADLEESIEVVIAGYQKKNSILTDKEKCIVAYHEIGHALVAAKQSNSAPVQKITIIPRTSGALGYTMQVDEGNHYLMSKEELENKIATLTGGRAAEEVVFQSITTGASNDIEQATKLARAMLTRYGMSKDFDMVALETVNNQYLGGDTSLACSAQTQREIDQKVVELVKAQHEKAVRILTDNRAKLDELAQYLYQKETITGEEFMEILNREPAQAQ